MNHRSYSRLVGICAFLLCPVLIRAADAPAFTRTEDVVYGRKYGTALTLDVIAPERGANGAAVVFMVSGGWFSAKGAFRPEAYATYLERGYTFFAVVHGSQPKYTIPEVLEDVHRAVRFIRFNAATYGIDPERIGVTGLSAGGHLSLMLGAAGKAGDPEAKDPVDRASSRVQAVACYFPPTDFMNYGRSGREVFAALEEELERLKAPFDFVELDKASGRMVLISDQERRREIARQISPVTHVTADDPPMLIMHGDADTIVPLQQAEVMIEKLEDAGVPAKLVTKPGAGHGWADMHKDSTVLADWFDTHLAKPAPATRPG